MRHSVGIRVWCGKVCNLHGMVGFGERSIRWVLAFWVAGFGRSETDKRRFLPSFSWGPVGQKPGVWGRAVLQRKHGACFADVRRCLFRRRAVPGPGGAGTPGHCGTRGEKCYWVRATPCNTPLSLQNTSETSLKPSKTL